MEWELVKPWINRVGLVIEFLSFWFVAPEIVTEIRRDEGEWLRSLERKAEQRLRDVPHTLGEQMAGWAGIAVGSLILFLLGARTILEFAEIVLLMGFMAGVFGVVLAAWVYLQKELPRQWRRTVAARVLASGFLFTAISISAKKAMAARLGWTEVGKALLVSLVALITMMALRRVFAAGLKKAVTPLLLLLADDKNIRRHSLMMGIGLFVAGFLLQVISTF